MYIYTRIDLNILLFRELNFLHIQTVPADDV